MKNLIKIIVSILFSVILYYFMLPPLNFSSPQFWLFIYIILIFVGILHFSMSIPNQIHTIVNSRKIKKDKASLFVLGSMILVFGLILIINFICSPMFNAASYHNRINVIDSDFETDIPLVDFNKLALLDKESSSKLGDRVMGQMTDLVSQFYVSNMYTQINYNDSIVRVTPLEYAGMIKYFTNRKEGIAGYITVDSVSGESNLVKLDNGMRYMPSAMFFENVYRKLRISYPTTIFGDVSFEIDDDGNPYWIAQTVKYTGVGLKKEISGVIVLDPTIGKSEKYDVGSIPSWIDHVYSADLIIEQLDDWGSYKKGFLNSIFGQKEVVMTTDGYNYLAMDDDIYLYTGITSVSSDESNIGFVLTNMRTKETKFYNVAGAEEYSAMASAEGQVQQMKYTSTFPLLINLNNKPTYLMCLKDNAGLVKMYAFVDYTNYQKVTVTEAQEGIVAAAQEYLGGVIGNTVEKDIKINSIKTAVLDGTTYYYIKDEATVYRVSIKINESILPFLKSGDLITITYKESDINEVTEINSR